MPAEEPSVSGVPNRIRTVRETHSEYSELCLPNDTNTLGNMLGGHVMHLVDLCGAIAAMRHAGSPVVTVSVDQMTFLHPVRYEPLTLTAELPTPWRSRFASVLQEPKR